MRLGLSLLLTVAALLAAGAGVTLWRGQVRAAAAETAFPPEGRFVTAEGARLHVVVQGTGPDLVIIHGASGSSRDMTFDIVQELAKTYRVLAFDRPGFGWSDPVPGAADIHVQARVIRAGAVALGAAHPLVLGHSYGGAVALAWATDAPDTVSALVLVSSPSQVWPDPLPGLYIATTGWLSWLTVPLIAAFVPESTVAAGVRGVFAPQPMPAGYDTHFGAEMSIRRATFALNSAQRAALKPAIAAMVPSYGRLTMPVEAVHGTADTTVPIAIHAEPLARQVPSLVLTALPGIGHMPHHVATAAVLAAVDRAARRAGLR